MGQYYQTYNHTKKQTFHPHKIGCLLKLVEQLGSLSVDALFLLLANSNGRGGGDVPKHPLVGAWAGDSISVQGDYAIEGDPGFVCDDTLETYEDISDQVRDMLQTCLRIVVPASL